MSAWRPDDEERVDRLASGEGPAEEARHAVIDGVSKVVDLPVLRPEVERVAKFIGIALGRLEWWCERGVIGAVRWVARRVQR